MRLAPATLVRTAFGPLPANGGVLCALEFGLRSGPSSRWQIARPPAAHGTLSAC